MGLRHHHRATVGLLFVAGLLLAPPARGEGAEVGSPLGHEIALGLEGVYDGGYDRGLHLGLSYELSWSMLRVGALIALGNTDLRRQQHWALRLGVQPWRTFRVDLGFHHRTFSPVGFGENLVTIVGRLRWRGLEVAAGWVLRFPILARDQIHSPLVFDLALFENFLTFRLGYQYRFGNGVGLGLIIFTHDRFDIENLDYPQFALVLSYRNRRVGTFRVEGGLGIAGFFNQGSTIDRGFVSFEYARGLSGRRRGRRR